MIMLFSKDRIGAYLLLIFSIAYGIFSQNIKLLPFQENVAFHARTMPEILTILAIGLSVLIIAFPSSNEQPEIKRYNWISCITFLALMSSYGLLIRPLGFILATSLFLIIGYLILGERNPVKLLLASVPLVVIFWVLMTQGLDVFIEPLPAFMKSGS